MATKRRHYRVAEKEIHETPSNKNGYYIPTSPTKKYVGIAIGLIVISFIKGLILGHLINRD